MASVVSNRRGGWEIRESHSTPNGPRSRTLATFRELDSDVLSLASVRAKTPLDFDAVERSARRVGAKVRTEPVERAARDLLWQLSRGGQLSPGLAGAVVALLNKQTRVTPPSKDVEGVIEWAGADERERGAALFDLLLLADALPQKRRGPVSKFPRIAA